MNGNLALSRALGDFEFKQNLSLDPEHQIVTCDPEIITHKIDGEEEFLVLACDGRPYGLCLQLKAEHLQVSGIACPRSK